MGRTSVGLVFRSEAVEAVTLKRTWRGVSLGRCARVNMTAETPGQAEPDDERVAQAIREALTACQVTSKDVVASVPARDALLRCFTMPLLPKAEREQAIQFEARKYIPFKIEELTWDYRVIEHRAANQLTVIFVGIRTDALARVRRWLDLAGVEPTAMEALSVSLTRAADRGTKSPPNAHICLVDIEQDVAHIVMMKDRVPYLSRDVSLSVQGESAGGTGEVAGDRRAELLLSELRLSFEFFAGEHPEASIGTVLLFGEEYTIAPWCAWFSEQLRCPVELGTLSVEVPADSPAVPLQFAGAVGLVRKGLRGADAQLDFLARPKAATRWRSFRLPKPSPEFLQFLHALWKPAAIQGGLAALCLLAGVWVGNRHVLAVQSRLTQAINTYPQGGWHPQRKTLEEFRAFQQQLEAQLTFLRATVQQRVSVAQKLDALAKMIPDGVWLEGLSYENQVRSLEPGEPSLTLRGACWLPDSERELVLIGEFVQRLKQDPGFFRGFASAQLGEILASEDPAQRYSYRTFRLNCQTQTKLF